MRTEMVNGLKVTAKQWNKGNMQRLYFSAEGQKGQACWDLVNNRWVNVHLEFGGRFKHAIKEVFGL